LWRSARKLRFRPRHLSWRESGAQEGAAALGPRARARGKVGPLGPPGTLAYTDCDSLPELWSGAGLREVETATFVVEVRYEDFDDYWQPFLTGTGPGGQHCISLDEDRRDALRDACFPSLGAPKDALTLTARSWAIRGKT
jgi:hypothetical protein